MFDSRIAYHQQVNLLKQFLTNPDLLRFEKKCVGPSEIGSQYYCEKKVELAYLYGTTETKEMILGTEAHEKAVEDFEKVNLEQIWDFIAQKGWHWIGETPFIMSHNKVFILRFPDQILFINSKPHLLFEFKFSKYRTTFPSQQVQAETYGLILKESGLDISSLFYVIILVPPELKNSEMLKELPKKISHLFFEENLFMHSRSEFQLDEIHIVIQEFNHLQAEKDLDHALEYWLKIREAEGTDNANKCNTCELLQYCNK